jgi:Ca2+-binding RTX toxin-like protein
MSFASSLLSTHISPYQISLDWEEISALDVNSAISVANVVSLNASGSVSNYNYSSRESGGIANTFINPRTVNLDRPGDLRGPFIYDSEDARRTEIVADVLLAEGETPAATNIITAITINQSGFIPPDPSGAAGLNHLVDVVNTQIQWFTKAGALQNTQSLQSFFSSPTSTFDPKVLYDLGSNRFIVMTMEQQGRNTGSAADDVSRIYVAASNSSDPNGGWTKFSFDSKVQIGGVNYWADYPGFAVDEQAIYITANYFPFEGSGATYSRLFIMPKATLYAGGTPTVTLTNPNLSTGLGFDIFTLQPAEVVGDVNGATTGTFLVSTSLSYNNGDEALAVIRIDNPLTSPTFNTQFLNVGNLGTTNVPDVPQLGSATLIDAGDGRAYDAVWKNNKLYLVNTIDVGDGQATAHWYQINTTNLAALTLTQQGNITGEDIAAGTSTYYPSIAVNNNDSIAIGFAASGPSIYGGAYFTIRNAADAVGTVQNSSVLAAGVDSYARFDSISRNRWGDYSGTTVDPADGTSFWFFNEYALSRNGTNGIWGTVWGKAQIGASPTTGNDTLVGTAGPDTIDALAGNDLVSGLAGADSLLGNSGDDTIDGGADADTINGNDGNDSLTGGTGNDTFVNSAGFDVITDFVVSGTDDRLNLSAFTPLSDLAKVQGLASQVGADTLLTLGFNNVVTLKNVTATALTAADFTLAAVAPNNPMGGTAGPDTITGTAGVDSITSGTGNDTLGGYGGNDTLVSGDGQDYLYGGIGNDLLDSGNDFDVLIGEDGNDTLMAGAGDDYLYGGTGDNVMVGGDGTGLDAFISQGMNDIMSGGEGRSYFYRYAAGTSQSVGGSDIDIFVGGNVASNDTVYGFDGADYIYGGDGNDLLIGGAGNDVILGQNGNDTIDGGAGTNTLWANDVGNDQINVNVADAGNQVIEFFQAGGTDDTIRLIGSTMTSFADYQALLANLGTNINGNALYNTGGGVQLYLNLGVNQTAVWIQGVSTYSLTAADFVFG